MLNSKKFSALKMKNLQDNEQKFGKEVRAKFGDDIINDANRKYAGMDQKTYDRMEQLSHEIIENLLLSMDNGNLNSEIAKHLVILHKEWLMIFWPSYTVEAHQRLADGYVSDDRFRSYYDQYRPGAAQHLRDCIHANTK